MDWAMGEIWRQNEHYRRLRRWAFMLKTIKKFVTISSHCPRGSYGDWTQSIHDEIDSRFQIEVSSVVDDAVPFDEINRTRFSFKMLSHFSDEFERILEKTDVSFGKIPMNITKETDQDSSDH